MASKTRVSAQFVCRDCAAAYPKWAGRCGDCGGWNTLEESAVVRSSGRRAAGQIQPLAALDALSHSRIDTGLADLNQVLGGGIVPGSVILIAGDPGIGKSTLVLQLAARAVGRKVLYISGEESAAQIKLRADRLDLGTAEIDLLTENDAEAAAQTLGQGYGLAVIDSIQTMTAGEGGSAGSTGQVTASAQILQEAAKRTGTALILIGHVTKDGAIAGPRILEHLVDTVLYLEGERHGPFKALRAVKNRFGSTHEVGIFEMTDRGLGTVENPSAVLLAERQAGPGSVVLPALEGSRPLLVEAQALVSSTVFGYPKRTASGFDLNRLNLLAAVLTRRAGLNLSNQDIYVNIVGGLKIIEPAADLAIILSIASAFKHQPLGEQIAVFGEVGLNGEVRSVGNIQKRVAEARNHGFARIIGPAGQTAGASYTGVATVAQAIQAALQVQ